MEEALFPSFLATLGFGQGFPSVGPRSEFKEAGMCQCSIKPMKWGWGPQHGCKHTLSWEPDHTDVCYYVYCSVTCQCSDTQTCRNLRINWNSLRHPLPGRHYRPSESKSPDIPGSFYDQPRLGNITLSFKLSSFDLVLPWDVRKCLLCVTLCQPYFNFKKCLLLPCAGVSDRKGRKIWAGFAGAKIMRPRFPEERWISRTGFRVWRSLLLAWQSREGSFSVSTLEELSFVFIIKAVIPCPYTWLSLLSPSWFQKELFILPVSTVFILIHSRLQ